MKILFVLLLLTLAEMSVANEPGWTPEERAKQCHVVIDATVTKLKKVRDQPGAKVALMRAFLTVEGVHKGKDLLGSSKLVEILFETSSLGAGHRCPTFPVLNLKQRARFYLHFDQSLSDEKSFVLAMGGDVSWVHLDSRKVIPELTKLLRTTPTFDELTQILGEPQTDIGSGIYIYVYPLDEGAPITVGTSDKKTVQYVKRGGERLYQRKAE